MLTFNDLLTLDGVDPADVLLARHQDTRLAPGQLHATWRNARGTFEEYQNVQRHDRFPVGSTLASFVVTESRKTVFVGLYQVDRRVVCPPGSLDPMLRHDISGFHRYAMHPLEALAEYQGKVVIDWGPGTRAWVQHARN